MLVITRKTGEGIIVSDDIEITVLEVSKDKVKIGVEAPKDIKIIRRELRAAQKANVEASKTVPQDAINALLKKGSE